MEEAEHPEQTRENVTGGSTWGSVCLRQEFGPPTPCGPPERPKSFPRTSSPGLARGKPPFAPRAQFEFAPGPLVSQRLEKANAY